MRWTVPALAEELGDLPVLIQTGRWRLEGRFRAAMDGKPVRRPANEFLDELAAGAVEEGYLAGAALFNQRGDLMKELRFEDVGPYAFRQIWIGPPRTTTPIHQDWAPNEYAQLQGRKRWRLWSPKRRLEPRLSQVGFFMSALDVHTGIDRAGPPDLDVVLEPGDMLTIPSMWWHRVETVETSVAVNRWWIPERLGNVLQRVTPKGWLSRPG